MKKKGFTLVELLAVIAILAILVIMALPAVLRMYRQARIDSFQNEVRKVYTTAQQQFMGEVISIGAGQKLLFTDGTGSGCTITNVTKKSLEMTGNSKFHYYVLINVKGEVEEVRATNGTYSFKSDTSNKDLKVEDIDVNSTTKNKVTLESNIADICSAS